MKPLSILIWALVSLAGAGGVYRVTDRGVLELAVAGVGLVGIAFAPGGGLVVASNDTVYRLSAGHA